MNGNALALAMPRAQSNVRHLTNQDLFRSLIPPTPMRRIVIWTVVSALFGSTMHARAAEPAIPSIEVSAEARVDVAADLAVLDFGVVTQAESAAAAAADNANRMEAVLAAVRKIAGKEARISTGQYAIRPVYAPQREAGSPRITGYEASNVLHLRTPALARVSELIDTAVRAGANQVQRIAFTLSDDEAPQRLALRSAVLKARADAQAIAAALDVKLGAVHSVVEQDVGIVRPLARQALAAAPEAGYATPIEPGQIEVRARVVLRAEIVR
jgi:uncharacterized protein YggE